MFLHIPYGKPTFIFIKGLDTFGRFYVIFTSETNCFGFLALWFSAHKPFLKKHLVQKEEFSLNVPDTFQ